MPFSSPIVVVYCRMVVAYRSHTAVVQYSYSSRLILGITNCPEVRAGVMTSRQPQVGNPMKLNFLIGGVYRCVRTGNLFNRLLIAYLPEVNRLYSHILELTLHKLQDFPYFTLVGHYLATPEETTTHHCSRLWQQQLS